MKHLKTYKIFESASSELNDEINDVLANATDYGYTVKIYDYYQEKDSHSIFSNKGAVTHLTSKIKLIKVSSKEKLSEFINIDDFSELGFNSSGFNFTSDDIKKLRDFYFELFDSLSHFAEYSPKISMSNDYVMIMLDLGLVSDDEINSSNTLKTAYSDLTNSLEELKSQNTKFKNMDIRSYSDSSLKIKLRSDETMSTLLASLCTQMSDNAGFSWMIEEPKSKDIISIRDKINNDGFNVSFKSDYEYTKLIITKK